MDFIFIVSFHVSFYSAFKLWRKRKSYSTISAIKASKTRWFKREEGWIKWSSNDSKSLIINFLPDMVSCLKDVFKVWPNIGHSILKSVIRAFKITWSGGPKRQRHENYCRQPQCLDPKNLWSREIEAQAFTTTDPLNRRWENLKALMDRMARPWPTLIVHHERCLSIVWHRHLRRTPTWMPLLSPLFMLTCHRVKTSLASLKTIKSYW